MRHFRVAAIFFVACAAHAFPQNEIVDGAIEKLTAKIVTTTDIDATNSVRLVTIEVKNSGNAAAEPVEFELAPLPGMGVPYDRPQLLQRFRWPIFGRVGRAVPAGGKETYQLVVPLPEEHRKTASIRVVGASFFKGPIPAKCPVTIASIESGTFQGSDGRTLPNTTVHFVNDADRTVDVAFAAVVKAPLNADTILRRRFAPKEKSAWKIDEIVKNDVADMGTIEGANVVSLRPIDWSLHVDRGEDRARAMFKSAYDRLRRWPADLGDVVGKFDVVFEPNYFDPDKGVKEFGGSFRFSKAGKISMKAESGQPGTALGEVGGAIERTLRLLRTPPFDEVKSGSIFDMTDYAVLRTNAPIFGEDTSWKFIRITGGGIATLGNYDSPRQIRRDLTLRRFAAGDDIVRVTNFNGNPQTPFEIDEISYRDYGAFVAPSAIRWTRDFVFGKTSTVAIRLFDLQSADPRPAPSAWEPTGDALILEKAWETPYRYPDAPKTIRGRYKMGGRLNDGLWEGMREISGTFRIDGFRGMLNYNPARSEKESFIVENPVRDAQKLQFGDVVADRFGLWASRDFGGRPKFRDYFAHSKIVRSAADPDLFEITDGPVQKVRLKDGLPSEMEGFRVTSPRGRNSRKCEYKKIGGVDVAVTVVTGEETLRGEWKVIAPGLIWPIKMTMIQVFGKDWGPEELTFSDVVVE